MLPPTVVVNDPVQYRAALAAHERWQAKQATAARRKVRAAAAHSTAQVHGAIVLAVTIAVMVGEWLASSLATHAISIPTQYAVAGPLAATVLAYLIAFGIQWLRSGDATPPPLPVLAPPEPQAPDKGLTQIMPQESAKDPPVPPATPQPVQAGPPPLPGSAVN